LTDTNSAAAPDDTVGPRGQRPRGRRVRQ